MLKRIYDFGNIDSSYKIAPAILALSLSDFRADATIQGLKAGRVATIGAAGVELATDVTSFKAGFIVNDAAGYDFENVPAKASGTCPLMVGGGVVETDQVVQDDLLPGDRLYVSDDTPGQLTTIDPDAIETDNAPFAIVLIGNSSADKTVRIQF